MKRSWIGLALLLVLLAAAIAVTVFMTRVHEDISLSLAQASDCAILGDWDNADLFLRRAKRDWTKWAHFRACFASHEPVEEIDSAFAALEIYRLAKDAVTYSASCAALARETAAIGQAHELVWWNLF